jgi:hypothetical protein
MVEILDMVQILDMFLLILSLIIITTIIIGSNASSHARTITGRSRIKRVS